MSRGTRRGLLVTVTIGAIVLLTGAVSAGGKGNGGGKPKPPPPPPPSAAYDLTELSGGPAAINDSGDVIGAHAVVALGSEPVSIGLGAPAADASWAAVDLNNEDAAGTFQAVGWCISGDTFFHAMLWEVDSVAGATAGPVDLHPSDAYLASEAFAINDSGEIAGAVAVPTGEYESIWVGTAWRPDGMGGFQVVELPAPVIGGLPVSTEAMDINNAGQVVGRTGWVPGDLNVRAVLWQIDESTGEYLEPIDLGGLISWSRSVPVAINDRGQVVGYANSGGLARQAWLITPQDMDGDGAPEWFWDGNGDGANDLMTALASGGVSTAPSDINSAGQVVGSYTKGNESTSSANGFIWQGGVMELLSDLVPSEYGDWYLPASCINEAGQIGGTGSYGKKHVSHTPYLLTPRP